MDQEIKFVTKRWAKDITTLSSAEIDRREARGAFPRRRRLSAHPRGRVVWLHHELIEWMQSFPPWTVKPVVADDSE